MKNGSLLELNNLHVSVEGNEILKGIDLTIDAVFFFPDKILEVLKYRFTDFTVARNTFVP